METKTKKMKMMTLDQMKDKDIGKAGTPERDKYEFELKMEVLEAGLQRISIFDKELSQDMWTSFNKLIDSLEDDDDVQKVYHNAKFEQWMNEL